MEAISHILQTALGFAIGYYVPMYLLDYFRKKRAEKRGKAFVEFVMNQSMQEHRENAEIH